MPLSDGLVGHWSPSQDDAGNGTTTLTDLSGNGNHGTLTNMDPATDWVADTANGGIRALELDGVDDSIDTSSSTLGGFSSGTSFSVTAWLWDDVGQPSNTNTSLMGKGYGYAQKLPWWMLYYKTGGTVSLFLRTTSGASKTISGTINLADSTWHSIVSIYDSSTAELRTYIDGSLDVTLASVPEDNYGVNSQVIVMGKHLTDRVLSGRLDSMRLYNRVLTIDEITLLASSRVPVESTAIRSPVQSHIFGGYAGPLRGIV